LIDLDPKRKHAHNGRVGRSMIDRRVLRDLAGTFDPLVKIQPQLMAPGILSCRGKQLGRAAGVGAHSMVLAFTDLHPGRGQLDQCLEHVGRRTAAAISVPEPFPDLVRLNSILGAVRPNEWPRGELIGWGQGPPGTKE
jgi:hypothetical protein